jgi:autotransporter-associated beta strand protein
MNGVLSGVGGITKLGPGPMTVIRVNTYSGGTNINEGLLRVESTGGSGTGSAPVIVNNGGTLGGSGVVGGAVNVASGGIVDPGSGSGGTLSVGGLTLNSGARLNFQGLGAAFDQIHVTGLNALNAQRGDPHHPQGNHAGITAGFRADRLRRHRPQQHQQPLARLAGAGPERRLAGARHGEQTNPLAPHRRAQMGRR